MGGLDGGGRVGPGLPGPSGGEHRRMLMVLDRCPFGPCQQFRAAGRGHRVAEVPDEAGREGHGQRQHHGPVPLVTCAVGAGEQQVERVVAVGQRLRGLRGAAQVPDGVGGCGGPRGRSAVVRA